MRKIITRSMAMVLVLLMLLPTIAFAMEERASSRIMYCSSELRLENNGDLDIFFTISASGTMKAIGATKVLVQRYNGFSWVTEHTYTVYNTPDLQTTNDTQHYFVLVYTPEYSGYDYRAVFTAYAQDSTGASTSELTSRSQWI